MLFLIFSDSGKSPLLVLFFSLLILTFLVCSWYLLIYFCIRRNFIFSFPSVTLKSVWFSFLLIFQLLLCLFSLCELQTLLFRMYTLYTSNFSVHLIWSSGMFLYPVFNDFRKCLYLILMFISFNCPCCSCFLFSGYTGTSFQNVHFTHTCLSAFVLVFLYAFLLFSGSGKCSILDLLIFLSPVNFDNVEVTYICLAAFTLVFWYAFSLLALGNAQFSMLLFLSPVNVYCVHVICLYLHAFMLVFWYAFSFSSMTPGNAQFSICSSSYLLLIFTEFTLPITSQRIYISHVI